MRELLNNTIRAGLAEIKLQDLQEPETEAKKVELIFGDSIKWKVLPDRLRIECTRTFSFEPECNFELKITYFVEHFLKKENALKAFSAEEMKKEISGDLEFYLQNNQGFAARLSLLAAQITSSFGGAPVITPPLFPFPQDDDKL